MIHAITYQPSRFRQRLVIRWHRGQRPRAAIWRTFRAFAVSLFWWSIFAIFALVIGLAMVINLVVAALVGVFIPITVRKFGIDPALASGVGLTTVTDVVGFFVFLGLATMLLI